MKEYYFKYYLCTVIAIILPIVVYILFPGVAGIPAVLSTLFVYLIYIRMRKYNLVYNIGIHRYFKWLYFVILFGAFHALIDLKLERMNIVLLLTHLLSWFMICICCMIKDARSIKYFCNAYLITLIPVAIFSSFFWKGFLTFDVPHILIPLSLFLIIGSYFSNKKCIFMALILFLSVIYDSSARSCLLTMLVCFFFFMVELLLPKGIVRRTLKLARITFFIAPIVFLILGVSGYFNVFEGFESMDMSSYNIDSRKSEGRLLNTDSRSGVYLDVLLNINGSTDLLIGKGSVITLPSLWTTDRHSVEAEILNFFLRYGLIGCLVFFLLLWKISKPKINLKSGRCRLYYVLRLF